MPKVINKPDDLPTEVEEWLKYFPQAKPRFQGGNLYISALLECRVSQNSKVFRKLVMRNQILFMVQQSNWRLQHLSDGFYSPPTTLTWNWCNAISPLYWFQLDSIGRLFPWEHKARYPKKIRSRLSMYTLTNLILQWPNPDYSWCMQAMLTRITDSRFMWGCT